MIVTTIVLSIPADVTVPSRTLRALRGVPSSAVAWSSAAATSDAVSISVSVAWLMSFSALCLGGSDLALADEGVDARDLASDPRDLGGVVELPGGVAEAQVERFVLRRPQFVDQLGEVHVGEPVGGVGACHR